MSDGPALAAAAAALVGCRFRLHGRDPATGLDCIGLVGAALAALGRPVLLPTGYGLRPGRLAATGPFRAALAARHGLHPAAGAIRPGEVWLLRPGPAQLHLAVVAPAATALVEAHAGLGRVVLTPLARDPLTDPALLGRWLLASLPPGPAD